MSEYVFPKVYSYTEGSGSGSGSGETFGPCDQCGFPPGTSIDTHLIDTGILVSSLAVGVDRCCPVYPRPTVKSCSDCGFPQGTNIDTHYIDTSVMVDIDATGQSACCPAVSRNLPSTKPCTYCGFPEGTNSDTHYIAISGVVPIDADGIYACCQAVARDSEAMFPCVNCGVEPGFVINTSATFNAPSQCCPQEPINDTECDPPCSGCSACDSEGNCVELTRVPCEIPDTFPSGTSIDTHYIDTTETKCPLDPPMFRYCPVLPRDEEDADKQTTVIDVPAKQIVSTVAKANIYKKGEGTLIIRPPATPSLPRPMCKSVIIESGNVILADKDASNAETIFACFGQSSKLTLNVGTNIVTCKTIQFGTTSTSPTVSYTSNTRIYSGTVDIGFGGLIIDNVPSITEIRSLLIAGRNDGSWNGDYGFVTTKEINGIKNIGYNVTENGGVIIKWASSGDTNLDGTVDILDVSNILSSGKYDSGSTDATWIDGDFNYDGILDILDVSLFLSQGNYDTGNYLPQNTEFAVSWTPSNDDIPEQSPITVTTNDVSKIDKYRIYPTTTQFNKVCAILSRWECANTPGSYFNSGVLSCHDAACLNLLPQFENAGACCKPDNSCIVLADTTNKTAIQHCQDLQGTWQGYNTTCADQTCVSATQQISGG